MTNFPDHLPVQPGGKCSIMCDHPDIDYDESHAAAIRSWGADPHTFDAKLPAGVWPKKVDIRGHFQVIGENRRSLVVADMGGLIDVGGIHVKDPAALDEAADRLRGLAERMRQRQTSKKEI